MPNESSAYKTADILRVVNAAASPTDLAEALAGSAHAGAGVAAARLLLEHRDARGGFHNLDEVSEVVDQHGPVRFDEVALTLANLARHIGSRVVGLVDPESIFSVLQRADGGVVRRQRVNLELDRGLRTTGRISYDDFVVELGLPGPAGFLSWVSETLADGGVRRSGEVHVTDEGNRSVLVRDFASAVITSVTFPVCDSSSKESAAIKTRFRPDAIRQRSVNLEPLNVSKQASVWQAFNFRVSVEGLPSIGVSRVDSFSWTQTIADDGSEVVELPNIILTIATTDFQPWAAWSQAVFANSRSDDAQPRNGTITYVAPDMTDEIGRVELAGLTPISLQIQALEEAKMGRFTVELSCQRLRFESK